jgi:ferritin-like protein
MTATDKLRNRIIDKLLTITNKDYLSALYQLVERSAVESDTVKLSEEQKIMLRMSEEDIRHGRLITQQKLDKDDLRWLRRGREM